MDPTTQKSESTVKPIFPHEVMANTEANGFISVFDTHEQAEEAVKQMQRAGFDMKKLSIVGRDYQNEENVIGFFNMGDRALYWGKVGAFWGALWGLLFGSAFIVIPGIGPLVIAGHFVAILAGIVESAVVVGGLSALGAALVSMGIPKNSVVEYETAIKAGRYVMIAHGSKDDLRKARETAENSLGKNMQNFNSEQLPFPDRNQLH